MQNGEGASICLCGLPQLSFAHNQRKKRNSAFIGPTKLFLLHDWCSIQSVCQQERRAGWGPRESMACWDRRMDTDLIERIHVLRLKHIRGPGQFPLSWIDWKCKCNQQLICYWKAIYGCFPAVYEKCPMLTEFVSWNIPWLPCTGTHLSPSAPLPVIEQIISDNKAARNMFTTEKKNFFASKSVR